VADTGLPWDLPYPLPPDLVRDGADAIKDLAEATATALTESSPFDSVEVVTATNNTWPVPALDATTVRVTCVGGGGGGGGSRNATAGGAGGTTTFAFDETFAVSASGGVGGAANNSVNNAGRAGGAGLRSANFGVGATRVTGTYNGTADSGEGGQIVVGIVDIGAATTLDLRIGAGGSGGTGDENGGAGGAGVIIVEYKAA